MSGASRGEQRSARPAYLRVRLHLGDQRLRPQTRCFDDQVGELIPGFANGCESGFERLEDCCRFQHRRLGFELGLDEAVLRVQHLQHLLQLVVGAAQGGGPTLVTLHGVGFS